MPPSPSNDGQDSPGGPDGSAEAAVAAAEGLLDRGEPLLAYDRAQAGLELWPGHTRLRQLQGLALARSGDVERANEVLGTLAREGKGDAETLGMLARTCKDLGLRAPAGAHRAAHLEEAFRLYERAYDRARHEGADADAYYAGINAATMAALLGDLARARRIAADVRDICRREAGAAQGATARYWREATLGEAALILGNPGEARAHYAEAARLAGRRYGDVSSTRKQARLLAVHLPDVDASVIADLAIPPVLVFTGNMIDQPGRSAPRFPAALEPPVREALRERIAAMKPVAAYGSAACGADLLCLELVRETGGETHVVLPFPPDEFRATSVDFAPGEWGARFDAALAGADSVTITSDHRARDSTATFEYANLVLTGMGRLRAQVLDTQLRALAAWDSEAAGAPGGAASVLPVWQSRGLAVDEVDLSRLREDSAVPPDAHSRVLQASPTGAMRHEMRSLLFADAVGYSKLSEDQIPLYVAEFLGAIAELNRRTRHRFEHVETAGDGLYMVFREARDAGLYALELNELASQRDWTKVGLPATLNLRIALHSGPVYCGIDPVTGTGIFTGPHTSRTARIEPITPPGQVYASGAFAAVASACGADDLLLRYVGRMPLAKGHGMLNLYHVRRAD
jgi:tetratricopeptide (TPR) repeat protein